MFSATEAELSSLYITVQKYVELCQTVEEMGWPQNPTPIQINKTIAVGVCNKMIIPKNSKAWTCNYTGSNAEKHKNNYIFIGRQVKVT